MIFHSTDVLTQTRSQTIRLTATKIDTPKHGRFTMRTQINA
jgi:hypothetical protein